MTVTVRIPGPVARRRGERVLDERGRVRQHVNVFVAETDIRETGGLATPLVDGVSVFVIPAVSGGPINRRAR